MTRYEGTSAEQDTTFCTIESVFVCLLVTEAGRLFFLFSVFPGDEEGKERKEEGRRKRGTEGVFVGGPTARGETSE